MHILLAGIAAALVILGAVASAQGVCTHMAACRAKVYVSAASLNGPMLLFNVSVSDSGGASAAPPAGWIHVASAALINETEQAGWYLLDVSFDAGVSVNDTVAMMGAGYIEAAMTMPMALDAIANFNGWNPTNVTLQAELDVWFATWFDWMLSQATAAAPSDHYWTHVSLVLAQLQGYLRGFNDNCVSFDTCTLLSPSTLLQLAPDVMDVISALTGNQPDWLKLSAAEAQRLAALRTHCSALVRLTDSGTVLAGHTTWNVYMGMQRVLKTYDLPLRAPHTRARKIRFSSYPVFLFSGDDFYMADGPGALVVMETTFNIFNASLYDSLRPTGSVITWIRGVVAMRMASDPDEWARTFARLSSGTNNNQWMAASTSRGTADLVIVEQIPTLVLIDDVSDVLLATGYWASYNIPSQPEVFNLAGYAAMVAQFGALYNYSTCPRARIFARNASAVVDEASAFALMRYNDWQNDPLSEGSPANAIASRFDLLPPNLAFPMGGTDTKVTVLGDGTKLACTIINGPTADQQTPFSWSAEWDAFPHQGLAHTYDFPPLNLA